jgi:hypothetical protein
MARGFLPRVIKQSRVARFEKEYYHKLAEDDFWFQVIEFENQEVSPGVFAHKSITINNYAPILSPLSTRKFVDNFGTFFLFMNLSVEEVGGRELLDKKVIDLTYHATDEEVYASLFDFDVLSGADRFYDSRDGTVTISASIENSLKMNLDKKRDELVQGENDPPTAVTAKPPNNTTWVWWLLLGIVSVIGLWLARR